VFKTFPELGNYNFSADQHRFRQGELRLVVDVVSGSIHAVDPVAWDLLETLEKRQGNLGQALADLTDCAREGKYAREELEEAVLELVELAQEGTLFNRDQWRETVSPELASPVPALVNPESKTVPAGEPSQNPVIKSLCLNVAHDCNLRCSYCFASSGNFGGGCKLMPFAVGKAALDFLVAHSANRKHCEVDFFGGEPLLNFEVVKQIVEYGRQLEQEKGKLIHFTLTTNAVLLDADIQEYLNQQKISVVLSLDGRPAVHDRLRVFADGSGSYDAVLPPIKALTESRQLDQDYYVRGTYTRFNLDFANDVLHLADQGFKRVSVEPVVIAEPADYALREEDLPQIFAEYDRLAKAIEAREREGSGFNFFHFDLSLDHGPCLPKRLKGCGAGFEYVAITPEGDIYPCHQFVGRPAYLLGNVLKNDDLDLAKMAHFQNAHIYGKSVCAGCWARFYCGGGCHANAESFNNTIYQPYTLGCSIQKKRLEAAIYYQARRLIQKGEPADG
jgi:uncharacterized protein